MVAPTKTKLVLKRKRRPVYVKKVHGQYLLLPPELKDIPGAIRVNPFPTKGKLRQSMDSLVNAGKRRAGEKTANPSPVERASKLSKKFHGAAPRTVNYIDFCSPKCLALIGSCAQLDYVSDKWDGKKRQYYHKFQKPCLVMADPDPQPDGSRLIVLLGNFKINKRGIIG